MKRLIRWMKSHVYINRYKQEMKTRMQAVENRAQSVEARVQGAEKRLYTLERENARRAEEARELSEVIGYMRTNIVDEISSRPDNLKKLNRVLSISPTVWGDENRLHISENAAVFTGFFNTNSGEITVGDYSFCGSNVSFLTGSHDMNLTGLLRRDCEIKEGNDIVIGNGVWIASNVTIIGPCKIGDNAVVGAGAVVLPGTEIPPNTVFAGVPAKMVSNISDKVSQPMDLSNPAVQDAIKRESGVLFADGWSEKTVIWIAGKEIVGHYMVKSEAKIYSSFSEMELYYQLKDNASFGEIEIDGIKHELCDSYGKIDIANIRDICCVKGDPAVGMFFGITS